jgi:hypothetical protein
MIARQTTAIAVKFFAMYLLFLLLQSLPGFLLIGSHMAAIYEGSLLVRVLVPLVSLAVGGLSVWIIWRVARSVIAKKSAEPVEPTGDLSGDELMRVILSCMGVYLALMASLQIVRNFIGGRHLELIAGREFKINVPLVLSYVAQLAVGCWFVAKPRQWVRAIRSIGEK